tara:strand:- start:138 stop:605 length:468 start_codon:yes stop_codon:yes gene_type:complete
MDNKTIKILENIDSKSDNQIDKEKLLNLLKLTKENNIELFDDKKGKIKSKRKIIQECTLSRNNKIDTFVKVLDEKKNKTKSNTKIKILNDSFMKELESIDNIVKYVNDSDFKILKNISDTKPKKELNSPENLFNDGFKINDKKEEFIEVFSNEPK